MSPTTFLLLFVLTNSGFCTSKDAKPYPCPFSSQCSCWDDTDSNAAFAYSKVDCQSSTRGIPDFASPSGDAYSVNGPMYLGYDVADLKAGQFSIFTTIRELHMEQRQGSSPVYQQWNETAFQNVLRIVELHVSGLAGLIPVPKALKNVDLRKLDVQDQDVPYELSNDALDGCGKLRTLELTGSIINKIDEQVFTNSSYLEDINLSDSGLNEAVIKALNTSSLKENLRHLDLSGNKIQIIQKDDFKNFKALLNIYFDSNPITDIKPGAFSASNNLKSINLDRTQIVLLDLAIFANDVFGLLASLSGDDKLTKLTISSLENFPERAFFTLTNSALQSVDPKIGDLLEQYREVHIDISHIQSFPCQTASWMVDAVFCFKNLQIDQITCSDMDSTLLSYLTNISSPDPCQKWQSTTVASTEASTSTTKRQSTPGYSTPSPRTTSAPETRPATTTYDNASGRPLNHDSSLALGGFLLSIFLMFLGQQH